jgi:hypothetical protein
VRGGPGKGRWPAVRRARLRAGGAPGDQPFRPTKFFELEGRFPQLVEESPQAAVDCEADVIKVLAEDSAKYDLSSRSAKGHRTQIREALGFRPATGPKRSPDRLARR